MKRIILALTIFALVLPATRQAEAGVDVSVDFFYNNLNSGGSWVEVGDYGYCWQPAVAVSNDAWRPYTDGYWAYTDVGWTWISNEDFGWATYHYGRWARVRDHGWIWVPGREWGPAWVSWRTGGDHVGWAPLPPRRGYVSGGEVVYEGRPINGYVDIDFDIGPAYYNFVDIRYLGGNGLRSRILPPTQNVTYISNTVNVTNITYENSKVYNHGPDYNRMSAYSAQPIQRLKLQRETNVDLNTAARSGAVTKVQGDTLMVAAPQQFKPAGKSAAPKNVKTKIAQDQLETGWSGVANEKERSELQAKMKKEDRKSIPPPDIKPTNPAALNAASTAPGASAAPRTAGTPSSLALSPDGTPVPDEPQKGKENGDKASLARCLRPTPVSDRDAGKNKRGKKANASQAATVEPSDSTRNEVSAASADRGNDRKGKNRKTNLAESVSTPGAEANPVAEGNAPEAHGKKKNGKSNEHTREGSIGNPAEIQQAPPQMKAPSEEAAAANYNKHGHGNQKKVQVATQSMPPQSAVGYGRQNAPSQGAHVKAERGQQGGKEKKSKKEKKGDEPPPQ